MPFDTTTQTRPEALAALRERYAALKLAHNVRPGKPVELSPEEAEAERRDRYNEPSERYDDGYDVERWARPGR